MDGVRARMGSGPCSLGCLHLWLWAEPVDPGRNRRNIKSQLSYIILSETAHSLGFPTRGEVHS